MATWPGRDSVGTLVCDTPHAPSCNILCLQTTRWHTHNVCTHIVVLRRVISQSFSFFKSSSSRQSVIFFTSHSHFFTWLTRGLYSACLQTLSENEFYITAGCTIDNASKSVAQLRNSHLFLVIKIWNIIILLLSHITIHMQLKLLVISSCETIMLHMKCRNSDWLTMRFNTWGMELVLCHFHLIQTVCQPVVHLQQTEQAVWQEDRRCWSEVPCHVQVEM